MRSRFWYRRLLATVLLFGGLCAAYWYADRSLERRIESAVAFRLPSLIGASSAYKVDAATSLTGVHKGIIESVRILGSNVRLEKGIKLQRLDTTLKGIHLDKTKCKVTRIDKAAFTAHVTVDELNSFLARHYPDIPSRVDLREGYLRVTAEPIFEGNKVRVEADAALCIEDGTKVVLRIGRLVSHPITAPDDAPRYIENRLNPVLDLSSLGFKGRINSITIHTKAIAVSGEGEPGDLPEL
ncbi:MAG: DUF2993 domain-containing protein [Armatimonadetes bacterium]|nr:DUF2993 domain-containing protein [Armatimonadota bacterium]